MRKDLEIRAESYMRSVMNGNTSDVFTRADVYEYIIEAYKHGYEDALCPKKEDSMYVMSEEYCQRITDMLNYTRETCKKSTANIKKLARLVSKEEFRNKLKH